MRAILLALLSAGPALADPCPATGGVEVPLFEGAKVDFLAGDYRAFHDKATSVISGTEYETLFNPLIVGAPKGFKSCTTILQRIETGGMVQEIVLFDTGGTPVSLYLMGAEMSGRMHVLSFRYSTSIGDVLGTVR